MKSVAFAVITAYLVILLVTLPASLLQKLLLNEQSELSLYDIHGTLWKGSAEQLVFQQHPLGSLDWQFDPFGLLSGKWSNQLNISGSIDGSTKLHVGITGQVSLSDVQLHSNLSVLQRYMTLPAQIDLAGELRTNLDRLVPGDEDIKALDGELSLTGLIIPGNKQLGDYAAQIETDQEGLIVVDFKPANAQGLQAKGQLTISPESDAKFMLSISNPDFLGETLSAIYRKLAKQQDDAYLFEWQGNLQYSGLLH